MHEQVGRDSLTLALMQQPGAQSLGESPRGIGPQSRQGGQRAAAQILRGLRIRPQEDLDQMVVGVQRTLGSGRQRARPDHPSIRGMHCPPGTRGPDDRLPVGKHR